MNSTNASSAATKAETTVATFGRHSNLFASMPARRLQKPRLRGATRLAMPQCQLDGLHVETIREAMKNEFPCQLDGFNVETSSS